MIKDSEFISLVFKDIKRIILLLGVILILPISLAAIIFLGGVKIYKVARGGAT